MLSFQQMYQQAQNEATDTVNTSFFKAQINNAVRILEAELKIRHTENSRTIATVNGTQSYNLPENFIRLKQLYVTVGTLRYDAEPIFDEQLWQRINSFTLSSRSNYLQKVFLRGDSTFEIFPIAASANNMTLIYEASGIDMQYDDYAVGNILTATNGGATLVGNTPSWTSYMAGRYIRINSSTSNGGDDQWYKIDSVTNTTTLVLAKKYQGSSIAGGTATYTIGQMCRLPEAAHYAPQLYALYRYYAGVKRNAMLMKEYKAQWDEARTWIKSTFGKQFSTGVIPNDNYLRENAILQNPNLYPGTIT